MLAVAIAPMLGLRLLLVPITILFSNSLTDGLLGLGIGVESTERDTMRWPPYTPSECIMARGVGRHIAMIGPVLGATNDRVGGAQQATDATSQALVATTVFTTRALTQLVRELSARSFHAPV